ncbi:hypothetical protein [Mesorhizobium sp. A556]
MEQEPINQPSANPTRKLSAAVIGAALIAVAGLIVKNAAPEWYDPEVFAALTPIVIFGLGYYVRDRPNVVVSE